MRLHAANAQRFCESEAPREMPDPDDGRSVYSKHHTQVILRPSMNYGGLRSDTAGYKDALMHVLLS